jgi:hypothetical protein
MRFRESPSARKGGVSHSQQNRFASSGQHLFAAPSHFETAGGANCIFWEGTWANRL